MNWRQIEQDWQGLRPLLRTYFEKLTNDDLERIGGHRNELAAVLHGAYGYDAREAERAIRSFEKDVRFPGAVK